MKNLFQATLVLLIVSIGIFLNPTSSSAQCPAGNSFGTSNAPGTGSTTTLTTGIWSGEYRTVNNHAPNRQYTVTATVGAATRFLTIRQGSPTGPVVASGTSPVTFNTDVCGGTYIYGVRLNPTCGTQNTNVTLACTNVGPSPVIATTTITGIPASACAGDNIVITGSGFTGATVVSVNGVNVASYTINSCNQITATLDPSNTSGSVSVTSPTGTATSSGSLTINPLPGISPTGPLAVCEDNLDNQTLQLTGTPSGGTWSSSSPANASVDGTGLVAGVLAGSTDITYTAAGCSITETVTVNPVPTVSATANPTEICLGDSAQLTATSSSSPPAINFFWSHGQPNGSFLSPTNNTLYIVEGTDVNGCRSDPFNVNVAVNPLPTLTATGDVVCAGDPATLTANASGGTGAYSYSWEGPAPGNANTSTANPYNFAATAQTDSGEYRVIVNDAKGCADTAMATLTVNPNPVISGTTTICADGSTSLTATNTPATPTAWTSSNTGVATVDNSGNVTGVSAGTTVITFTDDNGCTDQVTVTVNPVPVISGTTTICANATTQLTATNTPATPTAWVSSNTGVATVDNSGLVTAVAAGTTVITYTDNNGCDETVTITVNPVPVISGTLAICFGSNTTLTATTPGTATSWSSSNPSIASINASSGVVTGAGVGTVTITYVDANGCSDQVNFEVYTVPTITANTTANPVCDGDQITLTGGGAGTGGTYTWNPNTVTDGVAFTPPLGNTIYTVTGSDANACTGTASVTITVNPLPTVTANATATTVCEGTQITLLGGGANSYAWDMGVTDGTPFTPPVGTTVYTVIGTDANNCSNSSSISITVNPNPVITGPTVACADPTDQLQLNTAATGGVWASSDNAVATVDQNGLVTPVAGGTADITYTDGNGCIGTLTVTINALPNPTATVTPGTTCAGDPIQLDYSVTGGNDYSLTSTPFAPVVPTGTPTVLISNGTTVTPLSQGGVDDGRWNSIPLAHPFDYYGTPVTQFDLSTNGWISFNPGTGGTFATAAMPSGGAPNGYIALASEDLDPGTPAPNSSIDYFTEGTAPNRRTVIRYTNVPVWSGGGANVTTQVVLHETSNIIEMQVTQVAPNPGNGTTMGIEDPTNSFATVVPGRNDQSPWAAANEGWIFTPPAPLTQVWAPGGGLSDSTIKNPTGAPTTTTTYTVTVTDGNGCSNTSSVTATVNPLPVMTGPYVTCNDPLLTLQLSATNTPAASNPWVSSNTGVATVDNSGLVTPVGPGTTDITYTDDNGCTVTETVTVNALPVITAMATPNEICDGESVVTTATMTSGAGTPTWFWSHGQANGATVTPTGGSNINYTVFATDANGCSSLPVTIGVVVNPLPVVTAMNDTVCDGDLATFTAMATAGTGPYTTSSYVWSGTYSPIMNGTPFGPVTGTDAGTYKVIVTDTKGCKDSTEVELVVDPLPAAPTVAAVASPVCSGNDADFTISGVAGYVVEYNINGGATATATIGAGGTASVTEPGVTAATTLNITKVTNPTTMCESAVSGVSATVNVTTLPATPSISAPTAVCMGDSAGFLITGTATDTVDYSLNGGPSMFVVLDGSGQAVVFTQYAMSTQTLTLTQVRNNCFKAINVVQSIAINQNPVGTVSASTPASCVPGCDGTATIMTSGGTGPYNYAVSGTAGTPSMSANVAQGICDGGMYTIIVNDQNGCADTVMHTGTVAPNPIIVTSNQKVCVGKDATFTAIASGTMAPYSYVWTPAANAGTINNGVPFTTVLADAGTYTVTATDAKGCTVQTTATLTVDDNPTVSAVVTTAPSCSPGNDGVLTATATASPSPGSGPSFMYAVNGGAQQASGVFSSLGSGTYTIEATDGNGCTATTSLALNTATGPSVTVNSPTICDGDMATFTATVTPGIASITSTVYTPTASFGTIMDGVAFTPTLGDAGNYTVTVTDANNCTASAVGVLTVNPNPVISGSFTICGGSMTTLTATNTPATPTAWVSSNTSVATVDNAGNVTATLMAGTTDITYTDINGCSSTQTITVNPKPVIAGVSMVCRNAMIPLSASLPPAASNAWTSLMPSVATVDNAGNVTGVAAGTADIVFTDNNGCTDTFTVTVNPLPEIEASATPFEICAGDTTVLLAQNTATSPSQAINFFWTHSGPNPSQQSPAFNTTYFVFGTDANGCSSSSVSQLVQVNQLPTVTASDVTVCDGDMATLTATGMATAPTVPGVTYAWSGTFSPITNGVPFGPVALTDAGVYTVTVTDAKNCTITTSVNLNIDTLPTPATVTSNSPICDGDDAIFTISGVANDVVSYTINGGSTATATIGAGGTVDVTVTGASTNQTIQLSQVQSTATTCVTPLTASTTVTVNPNPTAPTLSSNSPICSGDDAIFTISGTATDIVTYTINGGAPAMTTIGAGGTVDVTVTGATADQTIALTEVEDANTGCTTALTATMTVTVNPLPSVASVSSNSPICSGQDAIFTISGTPSDIVSYSINGGATATQSIGASGTAAVTVVGATVDQTMTLSQVADSATGCVTPLTASTTVTVNPLPTAPTLSSNSPICDGDDAIFTITGTATDIVTYTINGGTPATTTIGAGGSVDVTVTGVSVDQTIALTQVEDATTNCVTPLTATMTVTVNPNPTAATVANNGPICSGFDAEFTISGTAGDTVTYSINGGASNVATIGAGGTVVVTVPGATVAQTITLSSVGNSNTGCTTSLSATSTVSINPLPVISGNMATCISDSMTLTATNTPAASGAWMSSDVSVATVNNSGVVMPVSSGTTVITYTDINGCIDTMSITINPLPIITASASPMEICFGDSSQLTAVTSPVSPTTATNFFWTHGLVNGSYLSPTANTTYFVYGTDANGCSSSSVAQLVQVNQLPTVTTSDETVCLGDPATFIATGMNTSPTTGSLGYSWSGTYSPVINGVQFTPALSDSGVYTVTVTDSKGCTQTATATLTVNPNPVVPTLTSVSPICSGNDAVFTLTGTPGDDVDYSINGGSTMTATIGAGGTVDVTVTGATSDQTITLSQVTTPSTTCATTLTATNTVVVNANPVTPTVANNGPLCAGNDVVFTITGSMNDMVDYNINGGTTATATIGASGSVDVTVTAATADQTINLLSVTTAGANPCSITLSASSTATVNALPGVMANASSDTVCAGDMVTLTGSGASTYSWDNSVSDGVAFAATATTTYTVTGTDGNGCSATSSVTVTVNPLPTVTATTTDTAVCAGGMVTLTGGGATTYSWDNGVSDGVAFTPTATTTYTVTGTDGNNCSATSSVTITVNPLPNVMANATRTSVCTGDSVTLTGSGASTYTWDNSVSDGVAFAVTSTTTYTVTGTDANGCSATSSVTITTSTAPVAPTVSTTDPQCVALNGTINISAPFGGSLEYSIDGTTYQSSPNFSAAPGTYNVTVRDTSNTGCVSAATSATINSTTVPCGPNVTVGALSSPSSIAEGGTANIDYFVVNSGTSATTGAPITILITKPSNGTLTLSPPTGWTITSNTAGSVFLTSNAVIQPGLINRVTIPAVYVHDNTNEDAVKTSNIKAAPGSGGEVITNDNEGQTFVQIN